MTGSGLVRLKFEAPYGVAYALPGSARSGMQEDRLDAFCKGHLADDREVAWLDEHAPNWGLRHDVIGPSDVVVPFGDDAVLSRVAIERYLCFETAAQRDAWLDRRRVESEAYTARMAAYRRVQAEAPEGTRVCMDCVVPMVPFAEPTVERVAQFAFAGTRLGHRCPTCRSIETNLSDDGGYVEAMGHFGDRVGLPGYESPLYDAANEAEYQRREAAEPEVTIPTEPGESCESILAKLDEALAASGRPPRGTGLRVVR